MVAPHLRQKVMGPRVYGEWLGWMSVGRVRATREKGRKCADCLAADCLAARMKEWRILRWRRLYRMRRARWRRGILRGAEGGGVGWVSARGGG